MYMGIVIAPDINILIIRHAVQKDIASKNLCNELNFYS